MKKIKMILLGLSLAVVFAGCTQSQAPASDPTMMPTAESEEKRLTTYTFKDEASGVQFTAEVPDTWKKTELYSHPGDENQEASPTTGVQFLFSDDGNQLFSIMAAVDAPFGVDGSLFDSQPYQTEAGLEGLRYTSESNGQIMEYFIFGSGETLPQMFAVVILNADNYALYQADIEHAVKSLKIV